MNNVCKVFSERDFKRQISKILINSSKLDSIKKADYVKDELIKLKEQAKLTSTPKQQVDLLKNALNNIYNSQTDLGNYIRTVLQPINKDLIFDENIQQQPDDKVSISSTFEEIGKSSNRARQKNFLKQYFKNAPNAKLYFQKNIKSDFVETFLVKRSDDNPRFYETQEQMNQSVMDYKQELLNKIFNYLESINIKDINSFPKQIYKNNKYTNIIESKEIKALFDSVLSPNLFSHQGVKSLDAHYSDFRDNDSKQDKLFLDAYNAWIILQNFDSLVEDVIGSVIRITTDKNGHSVNYNKYEIKTKATNILRNWTSSEDIEDISDMISDVTQYLIETSKMYKWGNGEPYSDINLSFADFNYIIGKIKNFVNVNQSDSILLNKLKWNKEASLYTKQVFEEITQKTKNKDISFKQLLSRIIDNPQLYFHTIFDVLCNTDLLEHFESDPDYKINDFEKNLIWSFNKEIFGGNENTRSLFRLHNKYVNDNIYSIVTQIAASTFPEEYLQYYENSDGVISTRLLRDYSIEKIKNNLEQSINQKSIGLNKKMWKNYNMSYSTTSDGMYLANLNINIKNDSGETILEIQGFTNNVVVEFDQTKAQDILNNNTVQNLFKDILGVNFIINPELKHIYKEQSGGFKNALKELSELTGRVAFNSLVNKSFVPKHNISNKSDLKMFILNQFQDKGPEYLQNLKTKVPLFTNSFKNNKLINLSIATAINSNLLSSAQSKTGEGTSLSNFVLSRLRNFYPYQIETQCKKENSVTRNCTFVQNKKGLFQGIVTKREIKTLKSNQQSTKFSNQQAFKLDLLNDFISAFVLNPNSNTYLKNGKSAQLPTVNSDKPQIDGLLTQLYAESNTNYENSLKLKPYIELTDIELESEIEHEFKDVYHDIIDNINKEYDKIYTLLYGKSIKDTLDYQQMSVIEQNQFYLNTISTIFNNDESLGNPKNRVINGLHKLLTEYNKTHFRNPIKLANHVHYTIKYDENGFGILSSNNVLTALYGRFNSKNLNTFEKNYLKSLYENESLYKDVLNRNGLNDVLSVNSYFKYKDYLTIKDLIEMKFNLPLYGPDSKVRFSQPEIQFLRGEMTFTKNQLEDPSYKHLIDLNNEMKNWVDYDGTMIIGKGIINGVLVNIRSLDQLQNATNITLHPMISKLNRFNYLTTEQYKLCTVGSHYAHSSKPVSGEVLSEESYRQSAANKRNVAETSTVHLYQKNVLNGTPSIINLAIIEDAKFDLYSIMGDLYKDGHKPMDGCMISNAWLPDLLNNSLGGERVGDIQKPFGTFYDELFGAGGIIKTALFPITNDLMRNYIAHRNLQKSMSSKIWIKEHPDSDGKNILETVDITENYFKEPINYENVIKGPIMYKKQSVNDPNVLIAYKLDRIESLGNNQYIIYEHEIDFEGNPISESNPRKKLIKDSQGIIKEETEILTINNNWDLFTQVFGGYYSLEIGHDGKLTWSENSNKLMVYAINNVGFRKDFSHIEDSDLRNYLENKKEGLYQSDIYQPLKYSDIHLVPNIGAIKSLQYNVNPDCNAIFEGKAELNHFSIPLAQFGIQLDKEHHADGSDVSFPTQIAQACANKGYTYKYTKKIYKAIQNLTKQEIKPFLDGIKDIIRSSDKKNSQAKLSEEVTKIIIDTLKNNQNEDSPVDAILQNIYEKVEKGQTLTYVDDIKGKIAWSDPTIFNKLFTTLSTTLSNIAVKMKFPGSLSIICPTDPMIKLYGDRTLSSFEKILDENGSTKTYSAEYNLDLYQESVRNGNEVDADGKNMLILDTDLTSPYNLKQIQLTHSENELDINTISNFTKKYGVIIDPDLKNHINEFRNKFPQGIIAYRGSEYFNDPVSNLKNNGFIGNPFSEIERGPQTVQDFYDWLVLDKQFDLSVYPRATEEYRQAIIDKILTTPENTPILYYTELNRPSHATVIGFLIKNKSKLYEINDDLNKLSKVSELKTQHNYIIEFEDGSKEEITINIPEEYFRVKNLVLNGKKININLEELITPVNYDDLVKKYELELQDVVTNIDDEDLTSHIYSQLDYITDRNSKYKLTFESIKKETGMTHADLVKFPGAFVKEGNSKGINIDEFTHKIWEDLPENLKGYDTRDIKNIVLDALMSVETRSGFTKYKQNSLKKLAQEKADVEYSLYEQHVNQYYKMSVEEYENRYNFIKNGSIPVTKIYENVKKGRSLSAYNVRFYNANNLRQKFQIYDLDSINLLFTLNNLILKDQPKGYDNFLKLSPEKQQIILNKIFKSNVFKNLNIRSHLLDTYTNLPEFNQDFIQNFNIIYSGKLENFVNDFYNIVKPRTFNYFQNDLFKLSDLYEGDDREIYVNGVLIKPYNITHDAYEVIMPKIYKTQFGLEEFDDLQEIIRDKDFFIKRGVSRFKCKFSNHNLYDYELKNFNGDHIYILDKNKEIPEELLQSVIKIEHIQKKGKFYRINRDQQVVYEMSSDKDFVCEVNGVEIIITDNPLFYVKNLNYNTLKVSPERVTEESYNNLINSLEKSKRINAKNYLKAISFGNNETKRYFTLKEFKKFNSKLDELTYDTVKRDDFESEDFKSIAQICRLINKNGRELYVSFDESLNLIAGRIPAQSQQSFMPQRVIAFDNIDRNTAYVSTFQLFLQGSDLDIDAVTLLGYDFDKNGKFIAWSPYFNIESKELLKASKEIPSPTGNTLQINVSSNAPNNFFEVYDKYFGTLFKLIINEHTGKPITKNGAPELEICNYTKEELKLLSEFLEDVEKYGINIKSELDKNGELKSSPNFFGSTEITLSNGDKITKEKWNLFKPVSEFGINVEHNQTYKIAQQLLDFVNDHNNYSNESEEYLKDGMFKNTIVDNIYKVSSDPRNQVECQESVDNSTKVGKEEAGKYVSKDFAPGGVETKYMQINEGQAGKSCVGIGAVAIKANSTTQYYLAKTLNEGSDEDLARIFFPRGGYIINGKLYKGFSNMYTDKKSDTTRSNFIKALQLLDSLNHPDQVTINVATQLGALLSLAVDNAKDLALAKINSGQRSMGLYAYGLSLGIPIQELVQIINSPEGRLLVKMTEGCIVNNDITAFKLLDVFDKLNGNLTGEINQYKQVARTSSERLISLSTNIITPKTTEYGIVNQQFTVRNTLDALYISLYPEYKKWFDETKPDIYVAQSLPDMIRQLFSQNMFSEILNRSYQIDPRTNRKGLHIIRNYINKVYEETKDITAKKNIESTLYQLLNYIQVMENNSILFKKSKYGKDLKTLAEGAEEMRILGAILGINKGLKATISETEEFIDMIENLIYDRKKIKGMRVSEADKIDFEKFMTNSQYKKEVINKYEEVKHSVNIPHLLSSVEHFDGYLLTEIIPISFFTISSIKYRTLSKYRKNIYINDKNKKPQSLFSFFNVDGKKEKDQILKGLENLIQFKLFTRWAYNNDLTFKIPKDFEYFDKKIKKNQNQKSTTTNTIEGLPIPLYTEAGLATFKKYMEEYYIPTLQDDPNLMNNEFVKNLTVHGYDKTPLHNEVGIFTLYGDLMAKKGRQAELNQKMFADFQNLAHYEINGLSVHDAFYLYAQYCYMGRKGQTSLMALFDSEESRSSLCNSFNKYIAEMDVDGNISCSEEELIAWCAPIGNQNSTANYAYVIGRSDLSRSLKQKRQEHVQLSDEEIQELQNNFESDDENRFISKPENFITYKDYLQSQYDQLVRDHFLIPSVREKVYKQIEFPVKLNNVDYKCNLDIKSDRIIDIEFSDNFKDSINSLIEQGDVKNYSNYEEFVLSLKNDLDKINIPYKTTLYKNIEQELDLGILQTLIEQKIYCP